MELNNCWKVVSWLALAGGVAAQTGNVVSIGAVAKVTAKRAEVVEAKVPVVLQSGYHVNSNTPSEPYLIPLRLTWEKGPFEVEQVTYPKPKLEKFDFSDKPISVFTGEFEIGTRFRVAAAAQPGPGIVGGKLRYQACNASSCLPPKTIEVRLPVQVR